MAQSLMILHDFIRFGQSQKRKKHPFIIFWLPFFALQAASFAGDVPLMAERDSLDFRRFHHLVAQLFFCKLQLDLWEICRLHRKFQVWPPLLDIYHNDSRHITCSQLLLVKEFMIVIGRVVIAALIGAAMLLTTGCQSLFISRQSATETQWTNWDQINMAFNKIAPDHTTMAGLQALGFDPNVTPDIKIMPYVDVVPIFMPNPNIHMDDLPVGVRVYVDAKKGRQAYLVELENVKEKRHGNLFLDVFDFRRQTHQSGWRFKGLILIKDGTVVYTLSSGEPDISREDSNVRPLGPFQEMDGVGGTIIGLCK